MDSDSQAGGAKKFLYTGPKKDNDEQDDLPWNFNAKSTNKSSGVPGGGFGVDDVWSIKRNVNLKGGLKEPKSEPLTFSTNKNYYSRYGESSKDKDGFGSTINTGGASNGQTDTKSWGVTGAARRPFSYAYSSEQAKDPPISPRNVSNSSASVYPQSGNSFRQPANMDNVNQSTGNLNLNNSYNQSGVGNLTNFDQSSSGNINSFGQSGMSSLKFGQSGNSNNITQSNGSGSINFGQSENSNMNNSNQSGYNVSQGPSWRSSLQKGDGSSTSSSVGGGSIIGKGERTTGNSLFNKSSSTNFNGQSHPRTMNSLFASSQTGTSRHSNVFTSKNKKSEFDSNEKSFW